ncbi:MAG: serine/threonine-protein kinase [Blastocatellia bacterium]
MKHNFAQPCCWPSRQRWCIQDGAGRFYGVFTRYVARGAGEIFLAQACGADEALRHEVESLLAYESRAATFIETPALQTVAQTLAQELPHTGQRISHFQILAPLGKGGMGEVYLALDERLGRQVAIKLLLPEFTANKTFVERFDQEARAASALNHPNIITVYEIDEVNGLHFIATELVNGQTLRQLMNTEPLAPPLALALATQIVSALHAAHEAGIVHRDIKPENVMRREDGLVKVLDFGLAKLTETRKAEYGARQEDAETLIPDEAKIPRSTFRLHPSTVPGTVMGTVAYMSPEQAGGQAVDGRSDLFSLGVILYEMLTGRLPFGGATVAEVLTNILHEEPAPVAWETLRVPTAFVRVIRKLLQKKPEDRYQSAQELSADLALLSEQALPANSA